MTEEINKGRIYIDYQEIKNFEILEEKVDSTNSPVFIKKNGAVEFLVMKLEYYNDLMIASGKKPVTKEEIDNAIKNNLNTSFKEEL